MSKITASPETIMRQAVLSNISYYRMFKKEFPDMGDEALATLCLASSIDYSSTTIAQTLQDSIDGLNDKLDLLR